MNVRTLGIYLILVVVSPLAALNYSDVLGKPTEDDLNELFKAQDYMKTLSEFTQSCHVEPGEGLDTFKDCIRILTSFNLKMADLKEEYGTIIDKYINS